jgi:hypothetical protein
MYWGWNALGNWVRVSVLVKQVGDYVVTGFGTCNSGGAFIATLDYDNTAIPQSTGVANIPPTGSYHLWDVWNNAMR